MPRAALLVTTLVLVAAVGAGIAGTGAATAGPGSVGSEAMPMESLSALSTADRPGSLSADGPPAALQQSFDRSVVRIRVDADGSARWTFRYKRTLETDQEREDFAAYAEEFNENETALYDSFRSDATALVAEGSNQTGRDMTATSFARDAAIESSLGNDVGVVELSFTWESFAEVDGDSVVVGDVFEGGLYVGPDQELVVVAGDDLVFESVAPNGTQSNPDSLRESDTVTWTGEQQFTDQRPRVVLVPESTLTATGSATATPSTPATTPETATATDAGGGEGGANWLPLLAAALVALVGAGWYRERSGAAGSPLAAIDPRSTDGGSAVGAGGEETGETAARGTDPGTETAAGAGAGTGAATDATTAADAGTAAAGSAAAAGTPDEQSGTEETANEPAVPDEAFLSDEDRVRKLLRENGGRMKQVRIVEETGWSKSKVSVLLSEMEEDDVISKLRVGRENVVSLDGHEPEAAKSPFDDEGDDA